VAQCATYARAREHPKRQQHFKICLTWLVLAPLMPDNDASLDHPVAEIIRLSDMSAYLFTVRDPLGHDVRLTEGCYKFHILLEHPELSDVNRIAEAVASPDLITQDAVDPQRLVYYQMYQVQPQRWTKVVVEQGEVVTAYRVRRLKQGEMMQWQR
jgi:hypothetical protein